MTNNNRQNTTNDNNNDNDYFTYNGIVNSHKTVAIPMVVKVGAIDVVGVKTNYNGMLTVVEYMVRSNRVATVVRVATGWFGATVEKTTYLPTITDHYVEKIEPENLNDQSLYDVIMGVATF